jgi:hypothetical protein
MNFRTAKKVLKDPDRYTTQQRYHAAHRLYRFASTFKNGEAGFFALSLKPQKTFHADDTLDLRYEYFLAKWDALEPIDFPPGEVVVPQLNIHKPVRRKDGQVHSFDAIPFPGSVTYRQETVVRKSIEDGMEVEDTFVINHPIAGEPKKTWEMGEWRVERPYSRKKYQIRTGGKDAGKVPPRKKRADYGLGDLTIRFRF